MGKKLYKKRLHGEVLHEKLLQSKILLLIWKAIIEEKTIRGRLYRKKKLYQSYA